jgi:D-xylose transport system substrate-binding protein
MKVARFAVAVTFGISLLACGTGPSTQVVPGKKIAFLVPDSRSPRYETQDRPVFQAKVQSMCLDCSVIYRNADGDAAAQRQQAESALAAGANVIVLDPVDGTAAAAIVRTAAKRHVPVIGYDNTSDLGYYVGFDEAAIGALQASALLAAMKAPAKPTIVMLHGDPTGRDANVLKAAVHGALDGKVTIAKEFDTPASSSDGAQSEMTLALAALQNKVDGVYAANDEVASGAVLAMKQAHLKTLPPVTGDDAQLSAVQRIIAGDQYMTVYRPVRQEAEAAAQLAYDLAFGVTLPPSLSGGKVLIQPVAVTRRTLVSTVIADGFWTRTDICTAAYEKACKAAGLT